MLIRYSRCLHKFASHDSFLPSHSIKKGRGTKGSPQKKGCAPRLAADDLTGDESSSSNPLLSPQGQHEPFSSPANHHAHPFRCGAMLGRLCDHFRFIL